MWSCISLHSDIQVRPLTSLSHFSNASGSDLPSFSPSHSPAALSLALPGTLLLALLSAPGEKGRAPLPRVFRKVPATCCSSPSVAVSSCQHEVPSNQEPTALHLVIPNPVLKIRHVGAGVGLGFMAPDDLPWRKRSVLLCTPTECTLLASAPCSEQLGTGESSLEFLGQQEARNGAPLPPLKKSSCLGLWICLPHIIGGEHRICLQCRRLRFDIWAGKIPWRREWQPTPYSCLENSMDRGDWWVKVLGVTESQTGLND